MSVVVLMGSDSDFEQVKPCIDVLQEFGISWQARVMSAHRTPAKLHAFIKEVEATTKVFICAAGGAAHLGGVVASLTVKPVLGIPILGSSLAGADSLYSFVQMPGGIPVATLGIGKSGAMNAGLLAAQILALADENISLKLKEHRCKMTEDVAAKDGKLQDKIKVY